MKNNAKAVWASRCSRAYWDGCDRDSLIYFAQIGIDGPIKIGKSKKDQISLRIKTFQCAHWQEVRLLGTVRGDYQSERAAHDALADQHLKGEWFRHSDRTLEFISKVLEAAKIPDAQRDATLQEWIELHRNEKELPPP